MYKKIVLLLGSFFLVLVLNFSGCAATPAAPAEASAVPASTASPAATAPATEEAATENHEAEPEATESEATESQATEEQAPLEPKSKEMTQALGKVYEQYDTVLDMKGAKKYTVRKGDTLSKISKKFYGTSRAYFFPVIMLASQNVVVNPDLVVKGMHLSIPNLQRNLDNRKTRAKIKEFLLKIADVYKRSSAPWANVMERRLRSQARKL
jgi:nucleoid-associated protein YgaU